MSRAAETQRQDFFFTTAWFGTLGQDMGYLNLNKLLLSVQVEKIYSKLIAAISVIRLC